MAEPGPQTLGEGSVCECEKLNAEDSAGAISVSLTSVSKLLALPLPLPLRPLLPLPPLPLPELTSGDGLAVTPGNVYW